MRTKAQSYSPSCCSKAVHVQTALSIQWNWTDETQGIKLQKKSKHNKSMIKVLHTRLLNPLVKILSALHSPLDGVDLSNRTFWWRTRARAKVRTKGHSLFDKLTNLYTILLYTDLRNIFFIIFQESSSASHFSCRLFRITNLRWFTIFFWVGSFFHESVRLTLNQLNHLLRKMIHFFEPIATPAG